MSRPDEKTREIEQIQQMFNLDDEQMTLQTSLMDTDDEEVTITPYGDQRWFKLIESRSGSATFLPISQNSGGNNKNNFRYRDCLTPQQTNFVYKKVELGSLINKNMIKEELDADIELERMDDNSGDENPYKELIVNNAGKIDSTLTQMEQWSILSNIINYVQDSKNPKNFHSMTIRPAKLNKVVKNTKSRNTNESLLEVNLVDSLDRSKEEYLDRYEGVKSEIVDTTRFDENSDLSTTYLGKVNMTCDKDLIVEERFPISKSGYTVGKLMDGMECQILLDTGASKSFMSKSYYLHCKALHSLLKFASKTQRIQVGNGQHISVLFIIPVIIEIAGHRFEIYTLVSEIHENVDLVLGIKNVFELEGVFNSWECCFSFLNRSLPIFPKEKVIIKPGEQKIVKIEVPFTDEISSLAIN